jgi:glycosyltransferase involved in cell wall biosynthesis
VIDITRHKKVEADEIYYPKSALALIGLLLRLKYDIVHLHFGGDLTHRLLALMLVCRAIPGKKLVMTFHSGGYPTSDVGKRAGVRTFRGFVLRRLDRVIGVNQALVDMYLRFGVPPDRALLIPPHALAPVKRGASDGASWPGTLARFFAVHTPVLLTVGLLEPEYDLPLQIDMLEHLRKSLPDAGLAIIGSGSLEREIRERIASKPYADHILLCGDVPHAVTLDAISRSSVLLRTTLYDGDSISVREALHLGTPVLATDTGMRPAGVHLLTGAGPESLSKAVERCIARPAGDASADVHPREADDQNLQAILDMYREL